MEREALQTQAIKRPARPGNEEEKTSMMYKGANWSALSIIPAGRDWEIKEIGGREGDWKETGIY